jgi:hypothetical protein
MLLFCLMSFCIRTHAAPPLLTDDASTLAPGHCQLEIERRAFQRRVEFDVVPACNAFWDAEVALGLLQTNPDHEARLRQAVLQFKKVLATMGPEDDAWAAGFAVSAVRNSGGQRTGQDSLMALFTRTIGPLALHANAGLAHDRSSNAGAERRHWIAATAFEADVTPQWTLVGEVFKQQGISTILQAGARRWVVKDTVQLTGSIGAQRGAGREGRWFSLGVRFER